MIEQANKKDNGEYAYLGMKTKIAKTFNVDIDSESVKYITETYLECIEDISLQEWIDGKHQDGKPLILTEQDLKEKYPDLMHYAEDNLHTVIDLFMYLYEQEFWIDVEKDYIYTTEFTLSNRKRLYYLNIAQEYERLSILYEKEILTWEDIDNAIQCICEFGYDIEKNYDYRTEDVYETADNIMQRIEQVF